MPYLQRNHTKIYYIADGVKSKANTETIIFIHTNLTDHTIFDPLIPLLVKKFNIVRYDLRGFGLSDLGNEELSIDVYVEDLRFLILSLQLESVHLAGFGIGALIALKFSTLYPENVKQMTLMTMACFPEESYDSVRAHRKKVSHDGTKIPVDTLLKKVTSLTMDDPEYARLQEMMSKVPVSTYKKMMDLTLYTNPIPCMKKTTKEALILSAEREVVFPQNLLTLTASYLDHFHYAVVPNSSSFLMVDQPETTAQLLTDFLTTGKQERYVEDMMTNEIYENVRMYTENVYKAGTKRKTASNEIHVDFLYSFQVSVNGKQIVHGWNQRYAKQILLYLLLHQSTTREQICDQFWPEIPLKTSKRNLRVYLYHLKRIMNTHSVHEPVLAFDREHIYLNGEVESDALLFIAEVDQALNEEKESLKYERTKKIINQLTSPSYLTAIFDDWFLELRDTVEQDLIRLSVWMGKWLLKNEEWRTAKHQLQNVLHIFGEHEEIYDVLLELDANTPHDEVTYR